MSAFTISEQPVLHPLQTTRRDQSIDIVKGIAITLVVFGHTLQGVAHRGWWNTPGTHLLNDLIYSFHMPAFFFVSGLLVAGSLARVTSAGFLSAKAKTILYPYVLWLLIRFADQPLTARFRSGTSASPLVYTERALMGDESWFLQCLFLVMVLALLTVWVPDRWRAAVAVALCVFVPVIRIHAVDQIVRYWAFFAAGQLLGPQISNMARLPRVRCAAALLLLAVAQFAAVVYLQPAITSLPVRGHALFLVLGLSGTAATFFLARSLHGTALAPLAAWTGEASIGIFLLHPYLQGATRELLLIVFHTQRVWLHLLVCTFVATLGSALLWRHRDLLRIGWLFRWGKERLSNDRPTIPSPARLVSTD